MLKLKLSTSLFQIYPAMDVSDTELSPGGRVGPYSAKLKVPTIGLSLPTKNYKRKTKLLLQNILRAQTLSFN